MEILLFNKCWQNKSGNHISSWQDGRVQVGHLDILGSLCHSDLSIYITDVTFTSRFFRLWICIEHLKYMYLSRVVLSEMMKVRRRAQVVKECRKCQHEQKTAERQLKTTETRVTLSILSFSFFVLGHSSLHLRDASLRVCIVKTAVSDQENWTEVAVRHHQKTGWRDKELYSKWREVQSKEWREWDHEVKFCGTPKKPWLVLNSGAPSWRPMKSHGVR